MNKNLTKILSNAWSIPEDLGVAEWGSKYMVIPSTPYGGSRFRPEMSPWLIEPLEALKDDAVREIVLNCSAQSGKSTYLYLAMLYALAEAPAPALFFAPTDALSLRYARQRIIPMLERCPKLKHLMPQDRKDKQLREVVFPNGSLMIGAANESFAQSWSCKYVFCDEVARFKNTGILSQIRARTTQYYDSKVVLASTPLDEHDDYARAWERTSQKIFHLACPECGNLISPEFDNLRWTTDETTKGKDGKYNFDELAKTVFLPCPKCKLEIIHNDKNWRAMVNNGKYVSSNPKASNKYEGYRWSAMCLPPNSGVNWASLVQEFLTAKHEMNSGYYGSLKEFVRLRCALPWSEQKAAPLPTLILEPYDANVPWKDAALTVMAVDVHGKDANIFWVGVRSVARNGDSRLMHYSREVSWQAIDKIRDKYSIPPHLVAVDSGYATFDVYAHCAKYGYTAWKGEEITNDAGYPHISRGRTIRRPWSVPVRVDIKDRGRKVTLFKHANNLVKDALHRCRTGRTHAKWLVGDVGEYTSFYLSQIDNEVKKEVIQKKTGKRILRWVKGIGEEQHAVDIEAMMLCMLMMGGYNVAGVREDTNEEEEDTVEEDKESNEEELL
jgi:phage terminase large subunit GpA-like protein